MANVKNPYRCPECNSSSLHQQLDKRYFNCLSCGRWFRLKAWKFKDETDKKPTQKPSKTCSHGIPPINPAEKLNRVIPIKVSESIREAVKVVAGSSVSEFCRTAIIEKLERIKEESH